MSPAEAGIAEERGIDPITFEVIRHKLMAITEEQAITLKSASGSPVVTDATDFNNGIYLPDGSIATMGPRVLFHSGSMRTVIKNIVETCAESPGIREGDMFALNDPYRGAIHQPDISVVAPVFYEGRHVAWSGACAHQLDVGGMSFSSWSFAATEIQQEALLLPGLKLVENGEIREDIWRTIMGMTRLPLLLGLDLKAMIAANNVATRRLLELMDRYGCEVVEHVMRIDIDTSEQQLRARLRGLPDGVFRAADFLDHDGHENRLYEFRLTVEKRGDTLTFDMQGSSPQAPGFINCTYSGLVGALYAALLPVLAPDIRWNEGLMRPVTVKAPEGAVCNATWPAPVSGGTVSGMWVCMNVGVAALARLAACSETTSSEAAAVTKGSMLVFTLAGRDRDGGPFGTFLMDSMAGGGGAYRDHDGLTPSADYCVPRPTIGNVETHEANGPFLFLYRRVLPDTGGAGASRGGATTGLAVTPHDVAELSGMLIGHGSEVPNSAGLFGGYEGSTNETWLLRSEPGRAAIGRISDPEPLREGGEELGAKPGFFTLRAGDVFGYSFQGGGGFGDPIDRDPQHVLADVEEGIVSRTEAVRLYGVVLDEDGVDAELTASRRAEIRDERVPGARLPSSFVSGMPIGPALRLHDGRLSCRCGFALGSPAGNFKNLAVSRVVPATDHGRIRLHSELELREHCCPACGTLLESEVARRGAPNLHTIQLDG